MTLEERLRRIGWDETPAGCWEWRGRPNDRGYGYMKVNGRSTRVHRIAHETWVGPIPKGLVVMHSCDNRICINPAHLSAGTQLDNIHDRDTKGRLPVGENRFGAKLTWDNVREIRATVAQSTQVELAQRFGVSSHTISNIVNNKRWREPQEVRA